jgi:hypothetical protein
MTPPRTPKREPAFDWIAFHRQQSRNPAAFPAAIYPGSDHGEAHPLILTNQLQDELQQYLNQDQAERDAERAARLSEKQKQDAIRQTAIDALGDALDRLNNNQETNQ